MNYLYAYLRLYCAAVCRLSLPIDSLHILAYFMYPSDCISRIAWCGAFLIRCIALSSLLADRLLWYTVIRCVAISSLIAQQYTYLSDESRSCP